MRFPRSLAARVTLAAVAAVGAALLIGGIAVVVAAQRSDQDTLDRDLERLVQARRGPALRALGPPGGRLGEALRRRLREGRPGAGRALGPPGEGPPGEPPGGGPPGAGPPGAPPEPLDPGSDRFIRAISPSGQVTAAGTAVPDGFPVTEPGDAHTVTVKGEDWRTITRPLPRGGTLQVAARLAPLQARAARLRRIVAVVALAALIATALAATGLVRLALAPLGRLRTAAGRVAETADLGVRVPDEDGPEEVRELAGDLNAMLVRLGEAAAEREAALAAARRFAADAGHELRTPLTSLQANLSSLKDVNDIAALSAAEADTRRLAALVEQLQGLARGEAGPPAAPEDIDAADLLDSALAGLRTRHPDVDASLEAPDPGPVVRGDSDGLRMLVDNLLENAARHGRPGGRVAASVAPGPDGGVSVIVDDDGPGIPAPEREAVLRRFVRGPGARGPGSGLGLAIAAAQAQRHGGTLRLDSSPLGGARAIAVLPGAGPAQPASTPSPAHSPPTRPMVR